MCLQLFKFADSLVHRVSELSSIQWQILLGTRTDLLVFPLFAHVFFSCFLNVCCLASLNVLVLGLFQVKSKLEILSSYADATDGLVTHGWITKIEKHGCFVRFYNGVQGFAPR